MEYNRREVIELKFQAQKQSSGQLYFAEVEIGLVKKKDIKLQTNVMQNQISSEMKSFSVWKGERSDAVLLSLILYLSVLHALLPDFVSFFYHNLYCVAA